MKRILNTCLCVTAAIILSESCQNDYHGTDFMRQDGIYAEFKDPEYGNAETKALSDSFKFHFEENDRISVFPANGDEYMTYHLTPSKGTANRAFFLTENFSLKKGSYYALYPAVQGVCNPENIVLSFEGQEQESNGSMSHLSDYDYCRASAEISDNSGYFAFTHEVSWVKLCIPAGENNDTFKSMTISADEGIAGQLTMNIRTGETGSPTRSKDDVLNILTGGQDGISLSTDDTLSVYVTIPPGTYTNLTVRTYNKEGIAYDYVFEGQHELQKGYYYLMNVWQSDVMELGQMDEFGLYRCHGDGLVYMWEPAIKYEEGSDQISWYHNAGHTQFDFFKLGTKEFMSFQLGSGSITDGGTYRTSIYSGTGVICTDKEFKAIRVTDSAAWLLNSELGLGCVIKLSE